MLVAIPTVDVVSPLKERYKELNYRIADQFPGLEPLLDRMRDMISKEKQDAGDKVNADVLDDRNESLVALVTDSLAVWGQMLWEHKDKDIDSLLTSR